MTETTKTIRQGNLRVELDRDQVFPDDPGEGCPEYVVWESGRQCFSASYNCAVNEGELSNNSDSFGVECEKQLTDKQLQWLDSIADEIDEFLYAE